MNRISQYELQQVPPLFLYKNWDDIKIAAIKKKKQTGEVFGPLNNPTTPPLFFLKNKLLY